MVTICTVLSRLTPNSWYRDEYCHYLWFPHKIRDYILNHLLIKFSLNLIQSAFNQASLISFSFYQPFPCVYKYRVMCFIKSGFNWTFCQLIKWKTLLHKNAKGKKRFIALTLGCFEVNAVLNCLCLWSRGIEEPAVDHLVVKWGSLTQSMAWLSLKIGG